MTTPSDPVSAGASEWSGAVAAVLDAAGTPCGAGFLAGTDVVVTCAHVVTAAGAGPDEWVRLAFPCLPGAPECSAWVDPHGWRPSDAHDVAVLRLREFPTGIRVLPLGSASGCRGHRVSVFGFPSGAPNGRFGYACAGDLLPDSDDRGQLLQLTAANDVTVGFSGAPVIDEMTGLAIGMITSISGADEHQRGVGVAYATAVATLRQVDPTLVEMAVCPYRGLAPFTAEHREWFHGRTEPVRRVIAALAQRAVLLLGPSGSGKSSLIQAGVLPALARGRDRPGSDTWRVIVARPAQDLLAELDHAGLTGASTRGLAHAVRQHVSEVPTTSRRLLVIDQFEELFTVSRSTVESDFTAARALLVQLTAVIREPSGLNVVLVMRDDFYPQLAAAAPDLLDVLAPGLVNVPATLTRSDLTAIITRPADSVGLRFEHGLVDQIITDLEAVGVDAPDRQVPVTVLPLLELALLQLWERRVDGRMTHDGYQRIGGVTGSLTSRCDQSIATLPPSYRPIARRMLTALVRPADPDRHIPAVRRQLPVEDLRELSTDHAEPEPGAVDAVLRSLTTTTPLIITHALPGGAGAAPVAELIHDALIRDWATLRDWVSQDSRFHDWLRRAEERQSQFTETTDSADLLRGSELAEGLEWSGLRRLPTPIRAFLSASHRAAQARVRRTRIVIAVMAVLLVLGITAAVTAFVQRQTAVAAQHTALSRQLAAQSQIQASGSPDLSALLAVHAHRVSPTREALASLYAAASAIRPLRHTLTGHASVVWSVAFSPDGRMLATGGGDATVRLWDVATGTERATLPVDSYAVTSVAFSPDGNSLATASGDRTVRLWDVATGRSKGSLTGRADVWSLAFSPDGKILATGSGDATVQLWDVVRHTGIATLTGHTDAVNSVAFSPDGRTLATGSGDATVRLWDVATRTRRAVLIRHGYAINSVAFSPDGKTLAAASNDHTVRLWDTSAGTSRAVLTGHTDTVNSVAFSPDGTTLATGSSDNTVRLWDPATATSKATLIRHSYAVNAVAFSPDGTTLATGSSDSTVRLWDAAAGTSRAILTGRTDVYCVAFSPDGRTLATAGGDNTVRLWDTATGADKGRLTGHTDSVLSVAFSPDARTLATASTDHTVRLWNAATRTGRTIATGHIDVWSVAFSPDGKTLAIPSDNHTVRLWDATTDKIKATLTGHTDTVNSVAFSPDGRTLATGGTDHTVRLWNATTGKIKATLTGHTDTVNSVAFSPDGKTVASASTDHTVRLWNVATATSRIPLPVDGYAVNSVAFGPDGRTIATASDNHSARLWDVATGTSKATLTGHTDTVNSVAFSPDGKTVATGSGDHTARLWDFARPDPVGAVKQICSAIGHEISAEEYSLYLPGEPRRRACP